MARPALVLPTDSLATSAHTAHARSARARRRAPDLQMLVRDHTTSSLCQLASASMCCVASATLTRRAPDVTYRSEVQVRAVPAPVTLDCRRSCWAAGHRRLPTASRTAHEQAHLRCHLVRGAAGPRCRRLRAAVSRRRVCGWEGERPRARARSTGRSRRDSRAKRRRGRRGTLSGSTSRHAFRHGVQLDVGVGRRGGAAHRRARSFGVARSGCCTVEIGFKISELVM